MRRRRVGIVVTGIAIAVGATSIATGALKEKSASATLDLDHRTGSATAECKRGSEAVAGGFDNTTFEPFAQVLPVSSTREGKRLWTSAAGLYNPGADPGEFVTYAYCDKSKPRLKTRSAGLTIGPYGSSTDAGSATAKCKRGSEAVSGGFEGPVFDPTFVDAVIFPLESRRDGKRKWTVSAFNYGGESGALTAYAYCDKAEPGLKAKSKSTSLGQSDLGSSTARCKKGSEVVSGGFDSPDFDPDATDFTALYPFESRRGGKRKWTAGGFNEASFAGDLVAYAYCKKK